MKNYSESQRDEATAKTRAVYVEMRDKTNNLDSWLYYDMLQRLQPELTKWAIDASNKDAKNSEIMAAFELAISALALSLISNLVTPDKIERAAKQLGEALPGRIMEAWERAHRLAQIDPLQS